MQKPGILLQGEGGNQKLEELHQFDIFVEIAQVVIEAERARVSGSRSQGENAIALLASHCSHAWTRALPTPRPSAASLVASSPIDACFSPVKWVLWETLAKPSSSPCSPSATKTIVFWLCCSMLSRIQPRAVSIHVCMSRQGGMPIARRGARESINSRSVGRYGRMRIIKMSPFQNTQKFGVSKTLFLTYYRWVTREKERSNYEYASKSYVS